MKIHFIYRKSNPGNYSIESIYDQLITQWKQSAEKTISPIKLKLRHNYDLLTFTRCWLRSLFGVYKVIHVTGGCNYMMMAFPRAKRILTIHDLYHLQADKIPFKPLYRLLYFTLPIRFSHKIVVVSEHTRMALIDAFPKVSSKVEVIPNPLHPVFNSASKDLNSATKPKKPLRILQIGSKKLKNFENLISATHKLEVSYTFIHGNRKGIDALIKHFQLADKSQVLSRLSSEDLLQVYLEADVLFFASLSEGFGLPLLEAQSVYLPVITSNRAPMNTIAPYAIHVDPESVEEIKEAFQGLMNKGVSSDDLKASKAAVSSYQVKEVGARYKAVYLQFT